MDFFKAQDAARRNTVRLVLYFVLALLGIVSALYLLVELLFVMGQGDDETAVQPFWDPPLFYAITVGVTLLVGTGSLYKSIVLSFGGGAAVAKALGARLVSRETIDLNERRLLNVVDEMALASGLNAPQVFVLDNESGINAFAAGTNVNKAVVAVTRGTLEQLNRDELQGVVAHEFSHILNGDMRLNIRLIGLLHGILLIAMLGRGILEGVSNRSGRSDKDSAGAILAILLFGLGLLVIGYIGVFFGQIIKAAVSRQREYLADASAVQFTRNPSGLADALKKIATGTTSSRIHHPKAESMSHMFFGESVGHLSQMLASHPPIHDRIQRLDPSYIPQPTAQPTASSTSLEEESGAMGLADASEQTAITPEGVSAQVGRITPEQVTQAGRLIYHFSEEIIADLNSPTQVEAILYGLLLTDSTDLTQPLSGLSLPPGSEIAAKSLTHAAWFQSASAASKFPAIELAIPALLELSPDERTRVLKNIQHLAHADGQLNLFEFALSSMLRNGLSTDQSARPASAEKLDLATIRNDVTTLLVTLAQAGHEHAKAASAAYANALWQSPIDQLGAFPEEPAPLDLNQLDAALGRLRRLKFVFRGRVIEACVAAISSDGKVTVKEAEMLRAIGACLDCPVPPLLPAGN